MVTPLAPVLVATDLDGTLLRSDDTVSPRTRAALARATAAGALHLVVTGRPVPNIRALLADLGYEGIAVCGQGTQVYDAGSARMLHSVALDRELAETALGKIEAEAGGVFAAVDQDGADGVTLIEQGYRMPHASLPARTVTRRSELFATPVIKVLVRHPELTDDELTALARAAVGDLASVTMAGPGTVELAPYGVDKGTGIALATAQLDRDPAGAVAFGDMPNDLPMFRLCGHGVAMADAHPELKAAADEITLSNEEDGVAVVLERLFDQRAQPFLQ
ncbi:MULTISPECIES: HAD family hydrolase [unclassified Streptomyces]|uniref:HAD family hydrolase n=1 Tax=Streptomyces TaxID=1883 RepID=UPI0001C197DF|nr:MULTISPECIES: HAD family hydrolase [unclassified Streptomyces]AEN11744.1 Cof-like hydrolase [Streptomyces sp. SirexAA-E]MYR66602.1 Cof-type HAD-IIB family hydrolase [Streptomyces sp. SID4939]MYS04314.1 Cof-type HAD-IIB family hydrolase [Streptomyces sp. SID4940]MYT61733.1 Cof-type HAD-IIB family hydrolase [Streptomyces sp. SID8357]MYT85102.1 Cof-type HAD-IIB family hydrolase [Streptomyces sp. SID8360]